MYMSQLEERLKPKKFSYSMIKVGLCSEHSGFPQYLAADAHRNSYARYPEVGLHIWKNSFTKISIYYKRTIYLHIRNCSSSDNIIYGHLNYNCLYCIIIITQARLI